MPCTVVVGAQWGDEAKGKVVDCLAGDVDVIVRYGGGGNAGHTVKHGDETYKLHHLPSGVLSPGTLNVLADGMVIDPRKLHGEIEELLERGIALDGLKISYDAHVNMPYHKLLDELEEDRLNDRRIGTTRQGVGPAFMDKYARIGIRTQECLTEAGFREAIRRNIERKNPVLQAVYGHPPLAEDEVYEQCTDYGDILRPYLADTVELLDRAVREHKRVLFEGAQGAMLDVDGGTYPFVTSSHPVAGGACLGTGVGPTFIDEVIGVSKAYATRVGAGAFPTELHGDEGQRLRDRGHEYGTTTGRPRRCGWLDTAALRYAIRIGGITKLAITKLWVLGGLGDVKLGVGYRCNGEPLDRWPQRVDLLAAGEPVYETLPGWEEDLRQARAWGDLSANAQRYVRRVEELAGVPIMMLSVGPARKQTILLT
jgi:adenylosuccinate synthase